MIENYQPLPFDPENPHMPIYAGQFIPDIGSAFMLNEGYLLISFIGLILGIYAFYKRGSFMLVPTSLGVTHLVLLTYTKIFQLVYDIPTMAHSVVTIFYYKFWFYMIFPHLVFVLTYRLLQLYEFEFVHKDREWYSKLKQKYIEVYEE